MNRLFAAALVSFIVTKPADAQTSYPMIMSLKPVAAQVGQTSTHTVNSRYSMHDAFRVLVTGDGVVGEVVAPDDEDAKKDNRANLQAMAIRFTIAPDAEPGVRDFRIATPRGASTLGQLVIARGAVISETGDNDTAEHAQAVDVPATLCGAFEKAEDVDYFKFHVEAGSALSFHVRCMRLQDKIHDLQTHSDPIITLRNAAGVTLAASDNYFHGDPFLGHVFRQSGEYLLEIRDVRFQGNKYWEYSIEISDQPFVTTVYPVAVVAGKRARLETIGFCLADRGVSHFNIPLESDPGAQWFPLPLGESMSNPVPMIVTELPVIQEVEGHNNLPEAAQSVSVPAGINGRIESEGDIDCFVLEAKKGERLSVQVVARRQQSALDSRLRILTREGKQLQSNDDMRLGKRSFADSWIENWTVPADGEYVIELRDLHLRGGRKFVYFLRVTRSQPYFELYTDTDKTQLTPGTGGVLFVRLVRKNGFEGAVQLHIDGLPDGVAAVCGRILPGKNQDGCIVLRAACDAPLSVSNVTIRGTAIVETKNDVARELTATAIHYQEIYQPGGGRGHWPVEMHTVSVGAPSDIRAVTLSTHHIRLQPGQSQKIDVVIERADGFDKNVMLDVVYQHLGSVYGNSLPAGVTLDAASSNTLLTGGATQGHITLQAADDAPPVDGQQIAVMANVSINFVMKATYASRPVLVTVEATR